MSNLAKKLKSPPRRETLHSAFKKRLTPKPLGLEKKSFRWPLLKLKILPDRIKKLKNRFTGSGVMSLLKNHWFRFCSKNYNFISPVSVDRFSNCLMQYGSAFNSKGAIEMTFCSKFSGLGVRRFLKALWYVSLRGGILIFFPNNSSVHGASFLQYN